MPATFRLVQIWLEHIDVEAVNDRMRAAFEAIESHKWLPLVYQMASRLSASNSQKKGTFQVDPPFFVSISKGADNIGTKSAARMAPNLT